MRGGHEGADVLHLHASFALENEGGPRAHVCVPWDGGLRARVVSRGAGEDFVGGGRGEEFEHRRVQYEVAAVGHL